MLVSFSAAAFSGKCVIASNAFCVCRKIKGKRGRRSGRDGFRISSGNRVRTLLQRNEGAWLEDKVAHKTVGRRESLSPSPPAPLSQFNYLVFASPPLFLCVPPLR